MNPLKRRIRDSAKGPTTYIAPATKIVGDISGQGEYIFCGTVEGNCEIDGLLTLAEGGRWNGTLKGTDIIVSGSVQGDVIATQRVEISSTARISGSLSGSAIAVADGAVIEGEIQISKDDSPVRFEEKRRN